MKTFLFFVHFRVIPDCAWNCLNLSFVTSWTKQYGLVRVKGSLVSASSNLLVKQSNNPVLVKGSDVCVEKQPKAHFPHVCPYSIMHWGFTIATPNCKCCWYAVSKELRAISLDPPQSHSYIKTVSSHCCDWEWCGREQECESSLRAFPHVSDNFSVYACSWQVMVRVSEALPCNHPALPIHPLLIYYIGEGPSIGSAPCV